MFTLNPKIEMFTPFRKPFSNPKNADRMVAEEIVKYMKDDNTKIVAKCTPCQCCACR